MKQRVEYTNNELGLRLAKAKARIDGGHAVKAKIRVFWYSYHHSQAEIYAELGGDITIF